MSVNDFGMGRELLIMKSDVRSIFTPHMPVQSKDFFFGRQKEVQKLIEHTNTPGQHALLYGERGVGKSSLANISAYVLQYLMKGKMYRKRCDSSDTFSTIMASPLRDLGYDINVSGLEKKHKQSGKAGLKIPVVGAEVASDRETSEKFTAFKELSLSPAWVAERLSDLNCIMVIDEADAIKFDEDKMKLAEFIKHLSDMNSKFKVLVVGIANTASDLTAGHPSVHRCLKETKLKRMRDEELREIIVKGAEKLRIIFEYPVINAIVKLSEGYPHFTHLLCLKCAEEAIVESRSIIKFADFDSALTLAGEDAECSLKKLYDDSVRSHSTTMYKHIVGAAAFCPIPEFSASDLRDKIFTMYGKKINQSNLSNYLNRLVSDNGDTLLHRVGKGVYKFNDPRMISYIKIIDKRIE